MSAPSMPKGLPQLPGDWRWVTPDQVATKKNAICIGPFGSSLTVEDYTTSGVPIVFVKNIRSKDFGLDTRFISKQKAEELRSHVVCGGDLLITKMGDPPGDATMYSEGLQPAIITADCIRWRIDEAFQPASFFLQAVEHPSVAQQIRNGSGGVAQKKMSLQSFKTVLFPCPPPSERARIAQLLATWDEALEKLNALIQAKEHRKKALMQLLLTGKKRLKGFDGEWRSRPIGSLLKEVKRPVAWDDDHLYRLVSIRRRSGGFFFREPLYGRDIKTKVMQTTKAGDFVIAKMQVLHGAMAMTPAEIDDAHVSGSYITLVAKDAKSLHMPFFDWLSRTRRLYHLAYISSYGVVIEKMTFVLRDFLKHEVAMPPTKQEQEAIADVLDTCDAELRLLRKQRAAIDRQKRGLMQRLLTGKVRVNP